MKKQQLEINLLGKKYRTIKPSKFLLILFIKIIIFLILTIIWYPWKFILWDLPKIIINKIKTNKNKNEINGT